MFPTLISLGPLTVHTYGLFIALAFVIGIAWASREARQRGLPAVMVQDMGFWAILAAIAGSRLLYVLLNPGYFLRNPLDSFMFWKGGLVFLGGALLVALTIWLYLRVKRQPVLRWADVLVPALPLGQAVGRLGCFAAGCCYGRECELPWAVTFSKAGSLAPLYVPLHPTQIYHSLGDLTTFLLLLLAKPHLKRDGQVLGLFLLIFPIFRIGVEFFRADFRGIMGPFSTTQVIAASLMLVGVWLTFIHKPKDPEPCSSSRP